MTESENDAAGEVPPMDAAVVESLTVSVATAGPVATAGLSILDITPEKFTEVIDRIDADLPKLKAAIAKFGSSPLFTALVTKMFPDLAPIIPMLVEVAPYIDFFQGLVDEFDKALHS